MGDLARVWDYDASVRRMRPLVLRWKDITEKLLEELRRAREELKAPGVRSDLVSGGTRLRTWSNYLKDIGLPRMTAYRLLSPAKKHSTVKASAGGNLKDYLSPKGTILYNDDCIERLKALPSDSVDELVTDPQYGLSLMSLDWDKTLPSIEVWKECLRVLKPGAFGYISCSPRQDLLARMITCLEQAGFNTGFTSLYWTYASGFPKANDLGKKESSLKGAYGGFQPKPAVEVVLVVQKPMTERTFAAQALENGKGGTWLDECRIPYASDKDEEGAQLQANAYIDRGNQGLVGTRNADARRSIAADPRMSKDEIEYRKRCSVNGKYETGLAWGGKKVLEGYLSSDGKKAQRHSKSQEAVDSQLVFGKYGPMESADTFDGRFPANLLVEDNVLDDESDFASSDRSGTKPPKFVLPLFLP